ncbi:MAG: SAM-dependent methyltransferase [Micromonosporaceae bacterium]
MSRSDRTPHDTDLDRPSAARIYDYNLGGSHNFAVDRMVAEKINQAMPELPAVNRANRSFLRRAVRFLARSGIRQFLDLGSGIPTVGNVHEIAQQAAPGVRVVYVDVDAVAVSHGNTILANNPDAVAVRADLRDPERILHHPQVNQLLDFDQPLAVLLLAVLHFVPDQDDPAGIVARLGGATVAGSYLAISHATQEGETAQHAGLASRVSTQNQIELTLRDRSQVTGLFGGYDLVEPGLVFTPEWRPDSPGDEFSDQPTRAATLAGVGIRR